MIDIDIDEEDIRAIHSPAHINDIISYEDIRVSKSLPLVVSYDLVDLTGIYGFQQDMTHEDTQGYFRIMKYLSGKSIDDLEDMKRELHLFHSMNFSKTLRTQLQRLTPGKDIDYPLIYHVGLYTDSDGNANREANVRSPRIFFMMGQYGIIHVLFFDPFHEILK